MSKEAAKNYRERHAARVKASKRKYYLKIRDRDREKRQEQVRVWREKNPEKHAEHNRRSHEKNKDHRAAGSKLKRAVKNGEIIKPTACSECGAEKPPRQIHAHHEDYRKWAEVTWLCPKCHGKRSRQYK